VSAQRAWIRWQAVADATQRRRWRLAMSLVGAGIVAIAVASVLSPARAPMSAPPAGMMLELAPVVTAPAGESRREVPPVAPPKLLSGADVEPVSVPSPPVPVLAEIELPVQAEQQREAPDAEQVAEQTPTEASQDAAALGDIAMMADSAAAPQEGASSLQQSAAAMTFEQVLLGHLQRHKRYPLSARLRRQEGMPLVRFTMNRQGRVLHSRLERGSGFALLDAEAMALLERAQPLPPLPEHLPAAQLEIVVPIEFFLGAG